MARANTTESDNNMSTLWVINFPRTNFYITKQLIIISTLLQTTNQQGREMPQNRENEVIKKWPGCLTVWCCLSEIGRERNVGGKIKWKGSGWVGR